VPADRHTLRHISALSDSEVSVPRVLIALMVESNSPAGTLIVRDGIEAAAILGVSPTGIRHTPLGGGDTLSARSSNGQRFPPRDSTLAVLIIFLVCLNIAGVAGGKGRNDRG